jgi:outer membrane immunogenic protein
MLGLGLRWRNSISLRFFGGLTMKTKTMLLASAAGVALMPNAQAADLPVKAAAPVAAPSWAGLYVGGHVGAAWQLGTAADTFLPGADYYGSTLQTNAASFIGGGQIGYNWQRNNIVLGVEADISGLAGSGRTNFNNSTYANTNFHQQISWLSTFRGRLGWADGNTLIYATGGLAVGAVKNSITTTYSSCSAKNTEIDVCDSSTRTGFAVGAGIEHMLNSKWAVRLEGLYVDLGSRTVRTIDDANKRTKFSNQAVIGRVGLNYKF